MSKSNKKEVGKGIRALLSNIDKKEKSQQSVSSGGIDKESRELPTKQIEANPFQPRREFDEDQLEELVTSIATHGIIQPIAVRKLSSKSYQIISGERRWRAAKQLKLVKVPVHIIEADDQTMLEMALLENIQRADLNPIEISISYQRLIDECSLTHEELSSRLGKKRSSITNYLRLLKLSPSVQNALKNNQITLGHAKVLGGVERIEMQTMLLGNIITDDLSVRATESLIKSKVTSSGSSQQASAKDANLESLKNKLSEYIGSRAYISRNKKGVGAIKIPFSSDDELNDIVEAIMDK